jgi:hypothetical protein
MPIYDFQKVYNAIGGRGKPIWTQERFKDILEQYESLLSSTGAAKLTTIYGETINVTLKKDPADSRSRVLEFKHNDGRERSMNVRLGDYIHIVGSSMMWLAGKGDESNVELITKDCPFFFDVRPRKKEVTGSRLQEFERLAKETTVKWEDSELHRDLVHALQEYAEDIRLVTKIVCFGNGSINPFDERFYIQHLAACTIAKTLSKAQAKDPATPNQIKIFAQDPAYTRRCREFLRQLDPPIMAVHYKDFGALQQVDRNTMIMIIGGGGDIVEPALDLTVPDGIAGLLALRMNYNVEEKCRTPDIADNETQGWASDKEWQFKERCICVSITDEDWFGTEVCTDYEGSSDEEKNTHRTPKIDENGERVRSAAVTELLLRRK